MEADNERIIGLYQRHALTWDKDRSRDLVEKAWLDKFLALLSPNASILDIGCGMGEPIARYLIGQGCVVTGVDSAPTFIDFCRTRFPHHQWLVADMRTLVLDKPFQGILAWDSFFHLNHDDQRRMFAVFRHHAAAGAALLFTSGPAHGTAIGNYQGEPLYHASLDSDAYHHHLREHGFTVVDHVIEDPACGYRTVWLAKQDNQK
ncbi:class I SAM-dependent methyltransferase [Fibrella sp. HMF5335]|uniref:Class I SAM-dependent methyltransferase n=1 Tax=Fibrella rubiginis TaxID=2817060 RepID=A0A939GKM5_9BACT|nr:class I SAM-dependent methyltransferase [Fibrella rubiginis]MBO0940066.1 class I SAM-dependent methyltransferase [Fibrella rubiginis]